MSIIKMRGPIDVLFAFKIFSLPVPTRPGTRTFWQVPDPSRPEVKKPYPSDPANQSLLSIKAYLIFVIFLHEQNFWRIKFTPKKRVNYDKIHRKLLIFCVITAKYTVNCQFFALNL